MKKLRELFTFISTSRGTIDITLFVYKIYYTLNSVQSFCKYKIQIFK